MNLNPRAVGLFLGASLLLAVVVVFLRARPSGQHFTVSFAPTHGSERVRDRLDQLRSRHSATTVDRGENERISAAATLSPRVMARPTAGPGPRAERGAAAGRTAELEHVPFTEDPHDIGSLQEIVRHDPEPDRRLIAVALLSASEDPAVIPALRQALVDDHEDVRMAALQGLADFSDQVPVEAIVPALGDADPDIRFEAVTVLATIGGEEARGAMTAALHDPDEEVRVLAETMLDSEGTSTGPP